MTKTLALTVVVIASSGCGTTLRAPAAGDQLPDHFRVSFNRWLGETFAVEQQGAQLLYTDDYDASAAHRYNRRVTPSREAWISFWHEAQSVGLWQWQPRYEEPPAIATTDGTQWQIDISFGNHHVHSSADNAYPSDGDPRKSGVEAGEPTRRFRCFEAAVRQLIGDHRLE